MMEIVNTIVVIDLNYFHQIHIPEQNRQHHNRHIFHLASLSFFLVGIDHWGETRLQIVMMLLKIILITILWLMMMTMAMMMMMTMTMPMIICELSIAWYQVDSIVAISLHS